MTEDEAFQDLDQRSKISKQVSDAMIAVTAAEQFIRSLTVSELSIMTIRKAFEVGYRQGSNK